MTGRTIVVIILLGLISWALPVNSHAHGHGWYAVGGFLGGVVVGTAIARPWYPVAPVYVYPAPPVVYAYPPPVYVYPPNRAYAYPDPAYAPPPAQSPPGEWVVVPGQWVDGKWVPSHRAWVPVNP